MQVFVNASFRFDQDAVQKDGGWCAGISIATLTHLLENSSDSSSISPEAAFLQSSNYLHTLCASYDSMAGSAKHGFHAFRHHLELAQQTFEWIPAIKGEYVWEFGDAGVAVLLLRYDTWLGDGYGDAFHPGPAPWATRANHAGIAVWRANRAFIFDPNCGGMCVRWQFDQLREKVPDLIDAVLARMYSICFGPQTRKMARIYGAKYVMPAVLPFGSV